VKEAVILFLLLIYDKNILSFIIETSSTAFVLICNAFIELELIVYIVCYVTYIILFKNLYSMSII